MKSFLKIILTGIILYNVFVCTNYAEDMKGPNEIEAVAAIVMEKQSGRVLWEKNAYTRRAIASTTKIMTAVIAIENGDLEDIVTVSKRAALIGGSTIKLKENEKIQLKDLLYGLMLKSGNDAAIAVAEHIGGNVDNFLAMMNEKAREIGAYDTSFKSPHGLDLDGHYSTAYDLAMITRYALSNPIFSEIVGTTNYKWYTNTNELLTQYEGTDGVKTGFTAGAGRCLVSSATRNNMRIISVVLNCTTKNKRAKSSRAILDYGFSNYKLFNLTQRDVGLRNLPTRKGDIDTVLIEPVSDILIPLNKSEESEIKLNIKLPKAIEAPIYKDVEVGVAEFTLGGKVIASTGLKVRNDVSRKSYISYIKQIMEIWGKVIRP